MTRVLQVIKEELGLEGWSVGDVIGAGEVGESVNGGCLVVPKGS